MSRKKMWFGTILHSEWIDAPLRGADMSPEGWETSGTLLSGGGYAFHSQDSHRNYVFEWSGASSRKAAETLQAYRDGVYSFQQGKLDLVYFIDPLTYSRNILPKRWAFPGIYQDGTFSNLETTPVGIGVASLNSSGLLTGENLPVTSFYVTSSGSLSEFQDLGFNYPFSLWVPIPEGESVSIAVWDSSSSGSGVYAIPVEDPGDLPNATKLTSTPKIFTGMGVLLGVVGAFEFQGARAVVGDSWDEGVTWMPGSGNSGCKFVGSPTWVANSGVNGGQIGFAATLKEVGDWH